MACQAAPSLGAVRYLCTDLCIYGGTSGGLMAAVAARRLGHEVVVLEPTQHLGGTTSGGLGRTDVGPFPSAIGGVALEFYQRAEAKYGAGAPTFGFEPKVASQVFREMLAGVGVVPLTGQELLVVRKKGTCIRELETAAGLVVRAAQFLDATYEGDLLAAAGAEFRTGREAESEFGESLNGIRQPTAGNGFNALVIDPYVLPGDAASGLLTGITNEPLGTPGASDDATQAYNFRLCLVQTPNRLPIAPPPNYRAVDYELVGRHVAAKVAAGQSVTLGGLSNGLLHNAALKNGKTDWNANQGMTSDWVGHSTEWITASWARRREIAKEHKNYIRGLLEFIRTDPRIPADVKTELATWGLPADEFLETQGWPAQLYVREARRMVGPVVLTQHHGLGGQALADPVALAVYALDSHVCRRLLVGGKPTHEGGFFVTPTKPWGIPLAALRAKPEQVENLCATFALSATHAAFSSARMEPVFMQTSQAAATAACLAISKGVSLANLPAGELKAMLDAQACLTDWSGGFTPEGIVVEAEGPGGDRTGSWTAGSNPGFHGTQYLHDGNAGQGTKIYRFFPKVPRDGDYRISLWWVSHTNRATNVPVTVQHAAGSQDMAVNMQLDPDSNSTPGGWKVLGEFRLAPGVSPVVQISNTGTNGFVLADAVRLEPLGTPLRPSINMVAVDATAREGQAADTLRFSLRRKGPVATALTVSLSYSGSASAGLDTSTLPTTATLAAGVSQIVLSSTATADSLLEGVETLQVDVLPNAAFDLESASVQLRIADSPREMWQKTTFSEAQIAAGQASNNADADGDGLSNLLEYHLGSDPTASQPSRGLWGLDAATWRIHVGRPLRKTASRLSLEQSPSLTNASWQAVPAALAPLVESTEEPGDFVREYYQLPIPPPSAAARLFYRFRWEE